MGIHSRARPTIPSLLVYRNIVFSNESHFWLNGYVNKQNRRLWSEDQPEELQKPPMHPEKVTVWCDLWTGAIIGPYLFTVREMISNVFLPTMQELDLHDIWFQQDVPTQHA